MAIKVHSKKSIVVVGGGTAGTIAAIAAARQGAEVLLVEKNECLGGTATAGLMNIFITFHDSKGNLILKGIPLELVERMIELGGSPGHVYEQQGLMYSCTPFDSETLKYVALELTKEAGVKILFSTWLSDVLVEGNKVKGVVIENKSGYQVILTEIVIDTTGDADVVARAGGEYMKGNPKSLQPLTLNIRIGNINIQEFLDYMIDNPNHFKLKIKPDKLRKLPFILNCLEFFPPWKSALKNGELPEDLAVEQAWFSTSGLGIDIGEVMINITRIPGVDATNADDYSNSRVKAVMQSRVILKFLREKLPGFSEAYIMQTASMMGIRETRRVKGEYILTKEDILSGRKFKDWVARSSCPIDIHESDKKQKYIWIKSDERGSIPYEIPYRCLIPVKIDNLLVGGRCISLTKEAFGSGRMMATCLSTGQAVGVAAAHATKKGVLPRKLYVDKIQNTIQQIENKSMQKIKLAKNVVK